ncbi:F-box domain-containing protein [Artemisia annua]|uniref:F-box domain-containing protein n=1 Tax=Artemisia annua TaxID=35608 RepID=A0A2U1L1Y0_ARTAN|nr:F-box domain-containing protein [Artemisia annua]
MTDVYIPDPIVLNILARLPAKPLLRFRCVSTHWNCLITDPSFMASRRRIFLTIKNLHIIDHSDTPHSILKISYPLENLKGKQARVIGTFKGLVLVLYDYRYRKSSDGIIILCNPFTQMCMILPDPPETRCCRLAYGHHYCHRIAYAYGFGYGENLDDLKIVRFKENNELCRYDNRRGVCEVFSFKKMTWSMSQNINIKDIKFEEIMGKFVNGYLYWLPNKDSMLIVLDVKEMVVSELCLPFRRPYDFHHSTRLGLIDGCLCLLNKSINKTEFDLWVMNEKSIWLKRCSFTLALDLPSRGRFHYPICILNDGRILIRDSNFQLVIYDISDGSYTLMNLLLDYDDISTVHGIEYVESLVSPLDVCLA